MSNPSKAKGTAAETAVVRWARANGFGAADRQPLRGNRDTGDIALCPGVIVEVKAHRIPTGCPTRGQLTCWMAQTETERRNAGADLGALIVKRVGTTDVGNWHAYLTAWKLAGLITPGVTGQALGSGALHAPACIAVADLAVLLRTAGWGDAP